jgi:membrane-associated phospholipid phosphatase
MAGMVSFPSFHTIVAVLTAWALWPLRIIGPIAVLLNAILIVSTVPWGGHYLIDIPAGAAIAVLGITVIAHRDKFTLAPMKAAPLAAEQL